jgi:hypothetical protein
MMEHRVVALMLAGALGLGGCAFVPKAYPRLEETRRLTQEAWADPSIARFAPAELQRAQEALDRASAARDTLDDPAVVDHLAYIAKQRLAIARITAEMRRAEIESDPNR